MTETALITVFQEEIEVGPHINARITCTALRKSEVECAQVYQVVITWFSQALALKPTPSSAKLALARPQAHKLLANLRQILSADNSDMRSIALPLPAGTICAYYGAGELEFSPEWRGIFHIAPTYLPRFIAALEQACAAARRDQDKAAAAVYSTAALSAPGLSTAALGREITALPAERIAEITPPAQTAGASCSAGSHLGPVEEREIVEETYAGEDGAGHYFRYKIGVCRACGDEAEDPPRAPDGPIGSPSAAESSECDGMDDCIWCARWHGLDG
ncbi:hypothetical protein HYW17_05360 [Candidatus Uhrbacteria bacterium]|nr:hypothetical protein [Candidatus Uhrbacteria bacterium]